MRLPSLTKPAKYVGLFAIDFDEWVSVGYTAEEVQTLLALPQFALAHAYRIHRVDKAGRVELAGWDVRHLPREEVIVLACQSEDAASTNFDVLVKRAQDVPPPCAVTIELAHAPGNDPPHVVRLRYAQHASPQVSAWLSAAPLVGETAPSAGTLDSMRARGGGGEVLAVHQAAAPAELAPRDKADLLRTVRQPVQR
jgi:hypothetical protein